MLRILLLSFTGLSADPIEAPLNSRQSLPQRCAPASSYELWQSFSSYLKLANYDIRTIQNMMGHSDVKTTMIYKQTFPSRTLQKRKSPLDMDSSDIDV